MLEEIITYKVKGLNFKKFLNLIKSENIQVKELQKNTFNLFFISIYEKDNNKFINITKKMGYEVEVVNSSKLLKTKTNIKKNISLFLCLIFIVLSLLISSNFVLKIEIFGCENISKQQIINILKENNINVYNLKSKYNLNNIEIILKQNIDDISLASAVIKGNTLIVNIDEKINNDEYIYNFQPIVAPYDCIIKEVALKSGSLMVQEGQTVKKGEVIIAPYINYKDGTQLAVEAKAEIKAYVELSNTIEYFENHSKLVRSGKKYIAKSMSIFNLEFNSKKFKKPFKQYEVEEYSIFPFKNFILPIKQTKKIYYELVEKQVFEPFENMKQNIIEQNKKILYNSLSNPTKDKYEVFSTINYQDNIYFVTTYLKGEIVFN